MLLVSIHARGISGGVARLIRASVVGLMTKKLLASGSTLCWDCFVVLLGKIIYVIFLTGAFYWCGRPTQVFVYYSIYSKTKKFLLQFINNLKKLWKVYQKSIKRC